MKKFTTANFANFLKYHTPFSQICEKYGISGEDLETAVRNVYHTKRADKVIRSLKSFDEQVAKQARKQLQNTPIIVVDEINDDNVDNIVAAVDEVFVEQPKSKLQHLQEKEVSLNESISEAERELEKLYGIQAEITQKVQSLTNEVRELKSKIEHKVAEVGELRDYSAEVKNQIYVSELDIEAIKKVLLEVQEAIKVEQLVTITVLADGWFKFEPETVDIPKVDVTAEELSEVFSQFVLDPTFESLTRTNIRQLLLLSKMIPIFEAEHPNINISFTDEKVGMAWATWKA